MSKFSIIISLKEHVETLIINSSAHFVHVTVLLINLKHTQKHTETVCDLTFT